MEKSASMFLNVNNTNSIQKDENGNPCEGIRLLADAYDNGKRVILRFRNGMLDGDLFDNEGNLVVQKPAVEAEGHQEYWRANRLHRDNGEPAVYSNGFTEKEWWENGNRIK